MDLSIILPTKEFFIFTAINLSLAIFVLIKAPTRRINIVFALMITFIQTWLFSIEQVNSSSNHQSALFWGRFSFVSPTIFLFLLLEFSRLFPEKKPFSLHKGLPFFVGIISAVLVLTSLSDLFIEDVVLSDDGPEPIIGRLFVFYGLYAFFTLSLVVWNLTSKYKNSSSIQKRQIQLITIGFAIAILFSLITNIIIPAFTGSAISTRYAPFGMIAIAGTISYSIIKHRFLDTRFLLGKITYYIFLSILPFATFYLVTFISVSLFKSIYTTGAYILGIFFAFLFVIFFNWAHNFIRKSIDSKLINPGYNPLETVDEIGNQLATILDVSRIGEIVLSTIAKTIRPQFESLIIIPNKEKGEPFEINYKGYTTKFNSKDFEFALKIWKITGKDPIIYDEIQQELFSRYAQEQREIQELREVMGKYQVKVLVPLGQQEDISGILLLGQKEADSLYTVQDIEFLKSIANTTRVAVERALFYEEVVDLNRNLLKKVDEATKELQIKNTDLQKALDLIKEVQRRERDMIDIMGHELRTPITIVRNAVSLLNNNIEKNTKIPPEILTKYIKMAQESAEREVGLIETLLSATKIDAQRLQLFRENVDFKDVIHDSILALKSRAEVKGLKIVYKEPERLPEVYADRTRIQEVMDNLLSNAIKYTEKGHIEVKPEVKGDFLQCSVTDTGFGIPEEDIPNLGRKFYRVKSHSEKGDKSIVRPGGTGLGLYVTFEIVKGLGGKVSVESNIGKGSTFSFTVPLYKDQKIEKALSAEEKDIFKRLGMKTKAEQEQAGEVAREKRKKPVQREIAD